MANLYLLFAIISIILLVGGASVYVRFVYTGELVVYIDFLLFTLTFSPSEKQKNKQKNRRLGKSIKRTVLRAYAIKRAFDFLLNHSDITVHEINFPINSSEPSDFAVTSGGVSAFTLLFLAYLSSKTQKTSIEDNYFTSQATKENIKPTFDLSLRTTLFIVLLSFFIYLLKTKRIKERSKQKNG